jgi:hypothetical protein
MASAGGTGGNGSSGGTSDMATASGGGGATTTTIKIAVPSTYTGQARQILVAAFDNFPVTGPPSGVIYMADNPVLTAGQTVTLTGDASKLTGTKYVIAVVYMTGGGTFSPKAGVDYESSDEKIVFTGQPIDLGTLTLALAM